MINIKLILEDTNKVIENLNKRNKDFSKEIISIKTNYENYLNELKLEEEIQSQINKKSKEIGMLKSKNESIDDILYELNDLKQKLIQYDSKKYKELYISELMTIPNLIDENVPYGLDEKSNVIIKKVGEKPEFSFKVKEHFEVETIKENFDFTRANKVSKSRFVITKNYIARLERALGNFMLDVHTKREYEELNIPFIVSGTTLETSSQLPKFKDDLFEIDTNNDKNDFYLIPTAEVVLANVHRNEIIDEDILPIKYTAISSCFRKEVGSAGKDITGIIRMHQFSKVELFKYVKEENADEELKKIVEDAAIILDLLKLPYQIVELCSGDLGFSAKKTYDLEVWMPGQNKYRECSSCSNVGDFQAIRGNIRYKDKKTKKHVHMLNGSGMATGRVLAAILENYQREDGSIQTPEVLKEYMR